MRFGSVCSGIEAASVAWGALGWRAAWLAEIEKFPSAVLAHHYPDVPNLGDMTKLPERIRSGEIEAPDVFCGGTPCQAFSVAGMRRSLDDARGNLSLTFCTIANEIDTIRSVRGAEPCIVFWENVPGVLSTKDNAFGCFLAGLAGEELPLLPPGGKWSNAGAVFGPARTVAWRVTDAQYFGVAQRRRRVFVVASARDGFDPATVLFEWDGLRRDSAPSREAGEGSPAGTLRSTDGGSDVDHAQARHIVSSIDASFGRLQGCSGQDANHGHSHLVTAFGGNNTAGPIDVATARNACASASASGRMDFESETFLVQPVCITGDVTHTLRGEGVDASEDGTGRGQPIVAYANAGEFGGLKEVAVSDPLRAKGGDTGNGGESLVCVHGEGKSALGGMQVRRLTVEECEFLQGFPRGYSKIPWRKKPAEDCPDGPRYKALGNSWAVPNVAWIGRRIVAELERSHEA